MQTSDRQATRDNETDSIADTVFLQEVRKSMLQFALLQLSDPELAEDVVQEALMGALKNVSTFKQKAALKTWIFSILKNKIVDAIRQRQRQRQHVINNDWLENEENDSSLENLFDSKGFWQLQERPLAWHEPANSMQNEHFWKVFDTCLNALPAEQGRIFMMREFLELSSDEICINVRITNSNLHVLLYRARLRLRECLENNWFGEG